MIQLIAAPPRTGKTYYCVNYLTKFTEYDRLYDEYVLKDNVLIISNIEGLKIKHWKLADKLKDIPMEQFFTIANFERIQERTGKSHVILAIDECHEFFPYGYSNAKIYEFFAYHGHIGLDIILMCQSLERTSRMFNPLLEYIVQVTPRTKSIYKTFTYTKTDLKGKYIASEVLTKKELVFRAYKSFRKDEHNKPKNAIVRWVVMIGLVLLIAGGLFKTALATVKAKANKKAAVAAESAQSTATVVTGAPAGPVPPDHQQYSSTALQVQQPPKPIVTVLGFAESDGQRKYLLSDGRSVRSSVQYQPGDIYEK